MPAFWQSWTSHRIANAKKEGKNITSIGSEAFAGCNKLKEIIVDESIDRVAYRFNAAVKVTEHRPFKSLIENLKNGIPVELHEKDEMSWSDWN